VGVFRRFPAAPFESGDVRRIAIRSVIVGALIDWFTSSLLGAVSVVVVLLLLSIAHTDPDRTSGLVTTIVHGNPWYIAAQIVIAAGCSLVGGYIAARLTRHDARLNGALSSFLSVGLILVSIVIGHDPQQLTLQILVLPVKPVLGFAGGYLYERQMRPTHHGEGC
jgi:MFS family permease